MSRQNSALASLTANYTDSEDDDLSPDAPEELDTKREDAEDSDGVGSGGSGTLVSYNLEQDQIDEDGLRDQFRRGAPIEELETEEGELELTEPGISGNPSPMEVLLDTETVSSDEDGFPSPQRVRPYLSEGSRIPNEPLAKCSPELQEQFTKMIKSNQTGKINMNTVIQNKKMFRNPSIYEKLISHLNIDEFGTGYPRNMYDPHEFPPSSYYDELAKVQKTEMDRRDKERRDRTKVEFVSVTVKKPTAPGPAIVNVQSGQAQPQAPESDGKRKSKWDQRGVMPPILMPMGAPSMQPVVLPASIVSSVAAAKAKTVINAFGTLPNKKPRNN